jgi:hypothetical protein
VSTPGVPVIRAADIPPDAAAAVAAVFAGRLADHAVRAWFAWPCAYLDGRRPIDCCGDLAELAAAARADIGLPEF